MEKISIISFFEYLLFTFKSCTLRTNVCNTYRSTVPWLWRPTIIIFLIKEIKLLCESQYFLKRVEWLATEGMIILAIYFSYKFNISINKATG
jgi:hypothetical protein